MRKANKTVGTSGLVLTVILLIVALAHFYTADVHPDTGNINEIGLFYFSIVVGIIHLVVYIIAISKGFKKVEQ